MVLQQSSRWRAGLVWTRWLLFLTFRAKGHAEGMACSRRLLPPRSHHYKERRCPRQSLICTSRVPLSTCFCGQPFDIVRRVKKLSPIFASVVVLSLVAYAASVSGSWKAKVDLGGQGGSPTFALKQDGEKLTGTYSGALGDAPLTGTVKGNAITFDFE